MKKSKQKKRRALWLEAFPEQATPNRAVLAGHRKARYERKARSFKRAHPFCQARTEVCTGKTNDVHHLRGRRGDNLLDDTKFLAVCRQCHRWIHENENRSIKLGLMQRRG